MDSNMSSLPEVFVVDCAEESDATDAILRMASVELQLVPLFDAGYPNWVMGAGNTVKSWSSKLKA